MGEHKDVSDIERFVTSIKQLSEEQKEQKKGDPQQISLKTALVQILKDIKSPKILDFGCGNGTLIPILQSIPDFSNNNGIYVGVNNLDIGDEISQAFVKSNFYKNQGSILSNYSDFLKMKDLEFNIIIIKNVIHEIQYIDELGGIIENLLKILQKNGRILVQDMEILADPELGNCPYMASDLEKLFEENGLQCVTIPFDSFGSIPLFTLIGEKIGESKSISEISDHLLSIREKQLRFIKKELYEQIEQGKTDQGKLCIAQHFDYVSIQKQVFDYKGVSSTLSELDQFKYYLNLYDGKIDTILKNKSKNLQDIPWFHDRGRDFEIFANSFLNISKSVFFLTGPRTIGKTTFIFEALKTRNPSRKPIYVKIPKNCDYWLFIENLFLELEIDLDLTKLIGVDKKDLNNIIARFIQKFAGKIILCFDNCENIIENNIIVDEILEHFISKLSEIINIKCIFISDTNLQNIDDLFDNYCFNRLGLFPKDYHVEQVLDALTGKEKFGIVKYPPELISAISRHPSIAYLTGESIRRYGSIDLVLTEKIQSIKNKVIDSILMNIDITPDENNILCTMSLLVAPEKFEVIEKIFMNDSHSFSSLVDKGLIYFYGSKYFILETIKKYFQKKTSELQNYNEILNTILDLYANEFKNNSGHIKINYHRKLINFRLFVGQTDVDIELNNEYYTAEISEIAETYFKLGEYEEALEIFDKLISINELKIKFKMRRAACLVRLNKSDGERYFEELIEDYKFEYLKSSYIDSLLYVNNYKIAFEKINQYFGLVVDNYHPYQIGQRAKIEDSFGNYKVAEPLYFEFLEYSFSDHNLLFIINMYLKSGDTNKALKTIEDYEIYFKGSNLLKNEKGKTLERLGYNKDAFDILKDLYDNNNLNAHYLLPLIKVLLNCSRTNKTILQLANNILKKSDNAKPIDLYLQARILLKIEEDNFSDAEILLQNNFSDEINKNNIHINGLKASLYMKKGIFYREKDLEKSKNSFIKSLEFTESGLELSNVPLLMQRLEILREMGETASYEETKTKILKINPHISL